MARKIKEKFIVNIQSKDSKTGRIIIEFPLGVRDKFDPGDTVKVTVAKV